MENTISKELFLQLREVAIATCHNSYLMDNGEILTNEQYKKLGFVQKLSMVMYYNYKLNTVCKL